MGIFSKDDGRRERWETLKSTVDIGVKQFRRTGSALSEIRDQELYRFAYTTFEECCKLEWKITARYAANLIDAAAFCEELGTDVPKPQTEGHFRPLKALPPEERAAAWSEAQAQGGTPKAIATVIAKRKPRKANGKGLKPLRLKVPGGSVVVTPNRKATDYEPLIRHALTMISARQAA